MSGRPDGILRLPGPSWWPLLGALGLLWFFFAFLMGAYAISPLGLMVTLVVCLRWAWDTGSETDPKALASGAGETLEVQDVIGARAPGAQGLVFTLIANGTLLASLLFGYGFLWTVGPQWPPESWIDLSPVAAFGVPALLVLGLWCVRRAHAKLGTAAGAVQGLLLAAATVAAVAAIAFFLLPVYAQLAPQTHAYDAIVAVMAGYAGVHAAMAALLCAWAAFRHARGRVSQRRDLDLRIARGWWTYTLGSSALILLALGLPGLIG